ncbi:MAG: hypothetical protein ACR2HB_04440 [Dehalococcoidia bacterium]
MDAVGTGRGDAENTVNLFYHGPNWNLQVAFMRVAETPIDAYLSGPDAPTVVETSQIAGIPAVFRYYKPNTIFARQGDVDIKFVRNGILVELVGQGEGMRLSELIKVAESIP